MRASAVSKPAEAPIQPVSAVHRPKAHVRRCCRLPHRLSRGLIAVNMADRQVQCSSSSKRCQAMTACCDPVLPWHIAENAAAFNMMFRLMFSSTRMTFEATASPRGDGQSAQSAKDRAVHMAVIRQMCWNSASSTCSRTWFPRRGASHVQSNIDAFGGESIKWRRAETSRGNFWMSSAPSNKVGRETNTYCQ
jgi:hypothetical protein